MRQHMIFNLSTYVIQINFSKRDKPDKRIAQFSKASKANLGIQIEIKINSFVRYKQNGRKFVRSGSVGCGTPLAGCSTCS